MKLADYNGHLVTLCLMATGTFAIGTDAFIVAGVLSDISDTFAVSPAQAVDIGIRAGLYAVRATDRLAARQRQPQAYPAVGAGTVHRRQSGLRLGHQLPADLVRQSAGRIGSGLLHAAGRRRRRGAGGGKTPRLAISIVYGGMTLAIALGIPFGTFLAKLIGWREIFLFIALLGQLRCWACRWRCAPLRHRASIR